MIQKRSRYVLALSAALLLVAPGFAWAQIQIAEVTYDIDGRTRQWVLEDLLDLEVGLEFADEQALADHIARQEQRLLNQRSLQEVSIAIRELDQASQEAADLQRVALDVSVRDTWNVIVLPYARYDSNTGLLLSLRGRDYNFFGTLSELEVNLDYERTEEEQDLFIISSGFSVPFQALQRRWRLEFDQELEIEGDEFDLDLGVGIGQDFDMLGLAWEALYEQRYRYMTNDEFGDGSYMTSRVSAASSVATGLVLGDMGSLSYRPEVFAEQSYRPEGPISDERAGVVVGFNQGLGSGGFDWIGNYRRGLRLRLNNENAYNIEDEDWDIEVSGSLAWFRPLWQVDPESWPKAGVSAAVSSFYLVNGADPDQDNAAAGARGVLNDSMQGDVGAFLNLDAVITFWTLRPVFEAQFGVFFDTALVWDSRGDFGSSSLTDEDVRYGTGIEIVGFPLFARSLFVRGSLGFDVETVLDGASPLDSEAREIFIGLGHHY